MKNLSLLQENLCIFAFSVRLIDSSIFGDQVTKIKLELICNLQSEKLVREELRLNWN
jgi:hypothetical protein